MHPKRKFIAMLIVGSSIVSDEIIDECFCCNIDCCKGICCVEGDYGAPITKQEKKIMQDLLPKVLPYLPIKNVEIIKKKGAFTKDDEGELVTQIVDNKDCVFAFKSKENYTYCVFQKLYLEKKINFIKPVSCHLYPIRIDEFDKVNTLNYHRWNICKSAIEEGKRKNIYIYQSCKEALIRRFGEKWYEELLEEIKTNKRIE